ncbi:MAG: hypothetical protein JRI95_02040 [Deltaproteobacteria bacterium]|nr:hypothetical protein [Deltaproteobacteria bacterium]MBW2086653.1 hypothetical protein [Deltaproteobacteria bacterium]
MTGAPIALYFAVNDSVMGGEISSGAAEKAEIILAVRAMDKIRKIEVIKNGSVIQLFQDLESPEFDTALEDRQYDRTQNSYYCVRITQEDGEMAWSSPVFFVRD